MTMTIARATPGATRFSTCGDDVYPLMRCGSPRAMNQTLDRARSHGGGRSDSGDQSRPTTSVTRGSPVVVILLDGGGFRLLDGVGLGDLGVVGHRGHVLVVRERLARLIGGVRLRDLPFHDPHTTDVSPAPKPVRPW